MIKILSYSCLILIGLSLLPLQAFAQYEVKDSYYFMKDDNEFSDEEKDEEAAYIHKLCEQNPMKKIYFDCGCIAGAFRQERDKEIIIPQDQILGNLFTDNQRGCANITAIAGKTYKYCAHYAKNFRARKKNNEEYCKCVANRVANDFNKKPYLRTSYIEKIRLDAMSSCE